MVSLDTFLFIEVNFSNLLNAVAAKGNNHIKVYKTTTKLESKTMLKTLNKVEREEEIALMLSAKKMTKTAKLHAKELLD